MHADRGVEIGIGRGHDRGGRPAGREPGDVDPLWVDRILRHDLAGDARDQRGLAGVTLLVLGLEPVPAPGDVGRGRLGRVGHQAAMLLGQQVHARAGGEVVGRLGAAVQHDHQWQGLAVMGAGHVELVGTAARLVAVGATEEPGTIRQDVGRCRGGQPGQPTQPGLEAAALEALEEAAQRFGHGSLARRRHPAAGQVAHAGRDRVHRRRCPPRCGDLACLGREVDDPGLGGGRCRRRRAGDVARLAAQQALQQGGGFAEPAGLDETGRGQQVGAVGGLGHGKHPGWRRAWVSIGRRTGSRVEGVEGWSGAAALAARITRSGRRGRP